jgi:hypothetical protein
MPDAYKGMNARTLIAGISRATQGFVRRSVWIVPVAALAYYLTYFNYGLDLDDEGFLLLNASSVLKGQWPMADFFSYQPLSYFLLALFFKILGEGLLTERIMLLALILINICLIHYCARRVLYPGWAWIPAAIYAFAPGPWYKVFFISHMLACLAALICFIERKSPGIAIWVGLFTGFAVASRFSAGVVAAIITAPYFFFHVWRHNRISPLGKGGASIQASLVLQAYYLAGIAIVLGATVLAYVSAGKLLLTMDRLGQYYVFQRSIAYVNATAGIAATFHPARLIHDASLEMWVYAIGLVCCIFNLIRYAGRALRNPTVELGSLFGLVIAAFGLGSMGYTYYYVWNSRILSSFAIVYINFFVILRFLYDCVSIRTAPIWRWIAPAIGMLGIAACLNRFITVQNYSGSYTTRIAAMSMTQHPLLRGIHVYNEQVPEILSLMKHVRHASPTDYLVSGSEATTMSYLSGLSNPTYYRLFLAEFAREGEEARAIKEFERRKIRFFVARRSQFVAGGGLGSNLQAYAPRMRSYLLDHYVVNALGQGFVLLERKEKAVSGPTSTAPHSR